MVFAKTDLKRNRPTMRRNTVSSSAPTRRGAITLELLLVFPLWMIALLAIIEFGQILSNEQQLALAARVGAEEASQTAELSLVDGEGVPQDVLGVIERQLAASKMSACRVVLEHNVPPPLPPWGTNSNAPGNTTRVGRPVTLSSGDGFVRPADEELPSLRPCVRVTVCAELTQLTPNLLNLFGFDASNKTIQHTTTFRYEL